MRYLIFLLPILIILAACNGQSPQPSDATPVPGESTPESINTDIPRPEITPTPQPEMVYLVVPPGTEHPALSDLTSWIEQRAISDGFLFETINTFPPENAPSRARIAIFLEPTEDPSGLAGTNPETRFIFFSEQPLQSTSSNLSIIDISPARQSFLAGYIAILVARDFRAGGLFAEDTALSEELREGYVNGARYLCGRCNSVFGPVLSFPQVALVPAGSSFEGWQSAFDQLNQVRILTLFVPPQATEPQFLNYLAALNVSAIGIVPPPEGFGTHWIATVQFDYISALDQLWPAIVAGENGQTLPASLRLDNVNDSLLTPGKMIMVEQVNEDLQAGWISPYSVRE